MESVGPIFKSLPEFFFQLLLTLGLVLIVSLESCEALKEVEERGHLHFLSFGIDDICDKRVVECVLQEKFIVHLSLASAQSPHLLVKAQQASEGHDGSPQFSWVRRVELLHETSLANLNLNRVIGDGVHG